MTCPGPSSETNTDWHYASCNSGHATYLSNNPGFKVNIVYQSYHPQQDWNERVKKYVSTQTSFTFNPNTYHNLKLQARNYQVQM